LHEGALVLDIIHILTGDDFPPPLLDSMVDLYVRELYFDFESTAWGAHYVDASRAADLVLAYQSLTEASRTQFLLSPCVYRAVCDFTTARSKETLDRVLRFARDQRDICYGAVAADSNDSPIWSPMGDCCMAFDGEAIEREWQPKLDSLITVDFDSPNARSFDARSPSLSLPFEPFSEVERKLVLERLIAALGRIDDIAPTFGRLIRNYTRTLVLRKHEASPGLGSEHVTSTIGEVRLTNVNSEGVERGRLADALVHESVHNMLSTYEYIKSPFVLLADNKQYRVRSPWTGNPIPVPSFCHAALVWFTLFNFADRELSDTGLTREERIGVQRRRNACASGFLVSKRLSELVTNLCTFEPSTLDLIDDLQRIVQNAVSKSTVNSITILPAALAG
jgi:hypothetical protein